MEIFGELQNIVLEQNGEDKMVSEIKQQRSFLTYRREGTHLNNILRRKANRIRHILRRNFLFHDVIEGQVTEVNGIGSRTTQLFNDLRNKRR